MPGKCERGIVGETERHGKPIRVKQKKTESTRKRETEVEKSLFRLRPRKF